MHLELQSLSKDFPEKSAQLQKLCQENPIFARKAEAYEALTQRLEGSENLDGTALEALEQEHASLKSDIAKSLKHASGSCCGGCGG
ncbi:MAG: hypothetical protein B7Z23_05870 [Pseudomonadales bacterium 32-61-5]|uniref:hypothetical protein n=1 Tax=Stutzerimonas stutzeri TaxID=316 RepID=UPI000BCA32F9|nr:hypothetical protein [Stutzerimonas stutzeri]MBF6622040.1 hypothetical protein [Stutzerimonas stutzeri]MCQ4242457.1 hypothetical protein [Stutzerimonas stutzeri]OYW92798.1 MAG: hypothetical protein B7Z23_05870 [Pseudomonadales bacterium 32-61-5]